jgi:methionyl aminopeptidase
MEKSDIDSYVKAGEIAKEVKLYARGIIKKGVKLLDVAEGIDAKILELGGEFAFPVNLSLNEYAAHFTPAPGDETVAEGILKIDIGVSVDGFIADTAFSIDLTEDQRFKEMIELNEKILESASQVVKSGMEVRDIGEAIQKVMDEADEKFAVIKSLCGHSLGQDKIHAGLTISNYRNDNTTVLSDNAFAVEPFVTLGVGDIFEGKGGGIYCLKSDVQVRDRDARKVLEYIKEEFGSRNFCARFLARAGFGKLRFILSMLVKQGILYEYPILIEKSRAPVSQVENTFVVSDGEVICTTKED